MNLKNQPPVLVPSQFQEEIEAFPKAKLMDMVWDMATRLVGSDEFADPIAAEIRRVAQIVQHYRDEDKRERGNWKDRLDRAANQ